MTAFGLYALFGGRTLLALLPSAWRDDPAGPVALDARALGLVTVRMIGFVLIAAHLPALVRAVQVGVSASDAWAVAAGVLPVAIGVYLLLGGGWIVRQASAVQGVGPRTVRVGAGGGTNP